MPDQDRNFQISVDSDLNNIPVITKFMEEALAYYGVGGENTFDVNVAVDEACTNIVQHAYPAGKKGKIDVSCKMSDHKLIVTIKDYGKPFDLTKVPRPATTSSLDERKIGGLGVYMIRKLMDELYYECKDGGEVITMIKYV